MNKNYDDAVKVIKTAILSCQYEALKSVNEKQLMLYYSIGKYISINTRNGTWGEGAIEQISKRLDSELPGLRGFSPRNLRSMRLFYEEWYFLEKVPNGNLEPAGAKIELPSFSLKKISLKAFFSIGFTMHRTILSRVKNIDERLFYINKTSEEKLTRNELDNSITSGDYFHQSNMPNNFANTIEKDDLAFKAIQTFKDQYLLDLVNVEELEVRDKQDIDEKVIENGIVHNIKKFILSFGKDFAFIRNQYHLEAFGEDQYIDLLFFNRELNCLVAIELKTGKFKTSYLGQLSGYLSLLDKYEKKEHENPSIGIILCKDMNHKYVDFVIQDYKKPMGVSTYKDMADRVKKYLPSIEELTKLLNDNEE